jgi:hypothetical protein
LFKIGEKRKMREPFQIGNTGWSTIRRRVSRKPT